MGPIPCQFDKKIHDQLAKFTITEENKKNKINLTLLSGLSLLLPA